MSTEQKKNAFHFVDILSRSTKPRTRGMTMVLDRGLGFYQAQDLMQSADYIDIIKLGWATPRLAREEALRSKVARYREHGVVVCNGGTLLEIVVQQRKLEAFLDYCQEMGVMVIEVSNGVTSLSSSQKADIIRTISTRGLGVISEVGKKDPFQDRKLSPQDRIAEARSDIDAGADYVIIEAREGGRNLGVYDETGMLKEDMARLLAEGIGQRKIMFEAPAKSQQASLVALFGSEVNLGNIRPEDVVPLETLRRGVRGDTFGKV